MSRGSDLQSRLSTLFTEYAPRVHSAAEDAEQRLTELEERDAARDRRDQERREQLRQKMGG